MGNGEAVLTVSKRASDLEQLYASLSGIQQMGTVDHSTGKHPFTPKDQDLAYRRLHRKVKKLIKQIEKDFNVT